MKRAWAAKYQDDGLTVIGVHEIAHQWWFGLVGNDQSLEPWLDEAMATYSEHIFLENTTPGLLGWWWNSRVNAYEPRGWVDTSVYNGGSFRTYTNAAYLVGAYFLDAVRERIGDEAFFAFLKSYIIQMAHQRATADDKALVVQLTVAGTRVLFMSDSGFSTEQWLLDLEREAFLSLCGEEKTQARIQFMLMKGKPLRN